MGLGSATSGNSGTYDRAVYMSNNGRLNFSSFFGGWRSMATTESYNDNKWHHLVVSQGLDGSTMYVDGQVKATDSGIRYGRLSFAARLRVGGDVTNAFPNAPSSQWFKGTIDDVSVYPYALTKSQATRTSGPRYGRLGSGCDVQQHPGRHPGELRRQRLDRLERSHRDLVRLGLRRPDHGHRGLAQPHLYSAAGTYTVTLTVTDSAGSEGSVTKQVVVHLAPTADFTHTESGLASSFDGTSSTATDGATITGYLWNFGDGETSTEAKPVHTLCRRRHLRRPAHGHRQPGCHVHRDGQAGHGQGARRLRRGHVRPHCGHGLGCRRCRWHLDGQHGVLSTVRQAS